MSQSGSTRASLESLAEAKKMPPDFLEACGLRNHSDGLEIRHMDTDGRRARARLRRYTESSHPTRWLGDESEPMIPFGASELPRWCKEGKSELWITEGETDGLTLRYHGGAAISIPGASMSRVLRAVDITGFPRIFITKDTDAGGEQFVGLVKERLHDLGFIGELRIVSFDHCSDGASYKDVSEMHVALQGNKVAFSAELQRCVATSAKDLAKAEFADGSSILTDTVAFFQRFVVITSHQATVLALWVILTHVFEVFECLPYLAIMSAEKRCGKSRLLEILNLLVKNAWLTGRTSTAALVRKIAKQRPTLLLDESDAAFGADPQYAETLRGVLNNGFMRNGVASVCVGGGHNVEDLAVYCPKAIAGIGLLPDTVLDRSIPIKLERRLKSEPIDRFRVRKIRDEATNLKKRIEAWAARLREAIGNAEPMLPDALDDRAQDIVEPLAAIADAASENWGRKLRQAAVELCAQRDNDDGSLGTLMLKDIRSIFLELDLSSDLPVDRIESGRLASLLGRREESPWVGRPGADFAPRDLAKRLRPFGISPRTHRFERGTAKGYLREDFEVAWNRYLSDESNPNIADVTEMRNAQAQPQLPLLLVASKGSENDRSAA